jgi:signal transduction histidine kinase
MVNARDPDLASVLGQLGAAWWRIDVPAGSVTVSSNCAEVLGLPPGHTLTTDALRAARPYPDGQWRTLESVHPGPNGGVRSRVTCVRDAEGAALEVVGIELPFSSDVVARPSRSPADVSPDGQLLRDILDLQPALVDRFRFDGEVVWCNEAYAAHMGRTVSEVVGNRWPEMVADMGFETPELMAELLQSILDATADGSAYTMIVPMPDPNSQRWLQWTNRRIPDPDGEGELMQGIGFEVTELRTARDALDSMARELVRTRVSERRALARKLHDDVVQVLVSAMWAVSPPDDGSAVDPHTASRGAELVRTAIEQLRACLADLTTPVVLPGLLADAVRVEADALRALGIRVDIEIAELTDAEIRTVCTRVIVEAMRNVGRHSKATTVHVSLTQVGSEVVGCVADNGIGANDDDLTRALASGHVGVLMSRAMVEAVDGVFEVARTSRSGGTEVRFRLPL